MKTLVIGWRDYPQGCTLVQFHGSNENECRQKWHESSHHDALEDFIHWIDGPGYPVPEGIALTLRGPEDSHSYF